MAEETGLDDLYAPDQEAEDDAALSKALSELEFAHITFSFGFMRWAEKCMEATGLRGLTALDILVLHMVNHRARRRRLSEISMVLNVDDAHLIAYSLKKLVAAELVEIVKDRRESLYETTAKGSEACLAYRTVRAEFLIPSVKIIAHAPTEMTRMATVMTTLAGIYDQATRIATAHSEAAPKLPPVRTKK